MSIAQSRNELVNTIAELKSQGKSIAYVPTMGALHEGHMSLVNLAKESADKVIVSIFVNPTQFAPNEDFAAYPRQPDIDAEKLRGAGVDLIYLPREEDIYPQGKGITTKAGKAAAGLETDFRPHFFDGVATVVHELFKQVQPDIAMFGEKDFQQLQVIRELVSTHNLGIHIVGAPIVRDEMGLALSSRNAYLSAEQLITARMLNKVLYSMAEEIHAYPREADHLIPEGMQALYEVGFDHVDYIEMRWNRILAAAWIGKTRLIDNVAI